MKRNLPFIKYSLLEAFIIFLLTCNAVSAQSDISYTIALPFPSNHLIDVEIDVKNFPGSSDGYADMILPAWRSGRYVILNPASGVQEFSALSPDGTSIPWKKTDKNTWRISGSDLSSFKVRYKVYANELGFRTRSLNSDRAYIDASTVLMYAEKMRFDPVVVNVIQYKDWHVTTGLDKVSGLPNSFYARDYDYLADCPLLIGTQDDHEFTIDGKKYTVSFSGEGNYNADTVISDYKKIIKSVTSFWKEIPYEHYTFMLLLSTLNRNATEHINSTAINVNPLMFSNREAYISFLSTTAHEFFHTWNVKQLRPKSMVPYDFENENYTSELWIAEGLTSYYEDIFMLDADMIKPEVYLEQLTGKIRNDMERPGNYIQTLADASFDAWVKYNADTQNKRNSESDFYTKGSALGVLLDLEIRHNSGNKNSLDDVFRDMYKNYNLEKGGYTNEDFIAVCEKYNGRSLKKFFDSYLYGLDTLDWNKHLNYAGLELRITEDPEKPAAGISTRDAGDRLYITSVTPESPAYLAGLDVNDEIIAVDGYRVRGSTLGPRLSEMREGDVVKFTVMREDKLREIEVVLMPVRQKKYKIEKLEDTDDLQEEIYKAWLRVKG